MPARGKIVFVGDTHGDLEASEKVINMYLKPNYKIVFLGDYVDRGYDSKGNIDFLLETRKEYPEQVYLLLGNHDAFGIQECYPNDFWQSLEEKEKLRYFKIFKKFPLVVTAREIMALHGVLPDVKEIKNINKIKPNSAEWISITWGDFQDAEGWYLGADFFSDRPQFGKDYFYELMKRFNKKILIRSHQPNVPEVMYNKRCLTIFTSSAYARKRTVAIADLEKDIKTTDNLVIKGI